MVRSLSGGRERPGEVAVLPRVSSVIYSRQNYVRHCFCQMKPYLDTVAWRAVDDVELVCPVVRDLLASDVAPLNRNRHSDCRLPALGGKYDNACILKPLSCGVYQHLDTIRVVAIIIHNAYCRAFHARSVAERMWIFAGHRVQCCWLLRA